MRSESSRTSRGRSERGETLVEFAFASVIFFTIVFGAIEFGLGVWNYNLVSDLAQEGARYAAVHGQNSGSAITQSDVQDYVRARAISLSVDVTTPAGAPNTKIPGTLIEVQVVHNLNVGGGLLPSWTFPVSSTARMIVTR